MRTSSDATVLTPGAKVLPFQVRAVASCVMITLIDEGPERRW